MKKIIKFLSIIFMSILLVGCGNTKTTTNTQENNNNTKIEEISKLKEGKYTQIAPSNEGSQGEGYDNYLTLDGGKAVEFDSYFGITTEGNYIFENDVLTIYYIRSYGTTTYGEPFDDPVNRILTCHIDGNKIIVDKMSDFDLYDTGSIIYELK